MDGRGRRPQHGFSAVGLLAWALAPNTAWASHPLVSDDAGSLGSGTLEIEVASSLAQTEGDGPAMGLDHALALHVGVLDVLDIGLTGAYELQLRGEPSALDFSVGADVKLIMVSGSGWRPGLATRLDVAPSLHDAGHELGLTLISSWESDVIAAHLNLGVAVIIGEGWRAATAMSAWWLRSARATCASTPPTRCSPSASSMSCTSRPK